MAEWHWELITDDLLDGLPPDALRAVEQLGKELAVRESMVFLDGHAFTGDPPGLRTIQRGPLMLEEKHLRSKLHHGKPSRCRWRKSSRLAMLRSRRSVSPGFLSTW